MQRRLGHSTLSVTKATAIQLSQWAKYSQASPEYRPLQPVMSEMQRCSEAAGNSSARDCSQMARLAASIGARMIAGCTIRAVKSIGSDHTTYLEEAIDGDCHNHYPPTISWAFTLLR
jgi:hypothetical protein